MSREAGLEIATVKLSPGTLFVMANAFSVTAVGVIKILLPAATLLFAIVTAVAPAGITLEPLI